MRPARLCLPFLLMAFAGCQSPDRVTFVTASEVGIGADATVGNVNIGYDRNELVVGPVYPETGALPPVYAKLDSDLAIFTPRIRQIYATGEAARLVSDPRRPLPEDEELRGERKLMVFGTTTNFGLKVRFTGQQPTSFNFGYKRKEFSVLPLHDEEQASDHDRYASVLAGISMRVRTPELAGTGVEASQFIATGDAANNLARTAEVRRLFEREAEQSLARAAVMGVPAADPDLSAEVAPICRLSLQRAGDPELAARLEEVESELGFELRDFCAYPSAARLAALRAKLRERGIL